MEKVWDFILSMMGRLCWILKKKKRHILIYIFKISLFLNSAEGQEKQQEEQLGGSAASQTRYDGGLY